MGSLLEGTGDLRPSEAMVWDVQNGRLGEGALKTQKASGPGRDRSHKSLSQTIYYTGEKLKPKVSTGEKTGWTEVPMGV